MLNFDDKLVRIPMPIIATLAPSQDTTSDQLAAFYRQPGIPFTRHSPLPVAASAPTNALINSAKKLLILLALLVCGSARAATPPAVTVRASSIDILGASQPISITVNLIDPSNTGMLSVAGTGVVPIMRATTVTPGTTVTVGPIYGNDIILNGYGVANTTYYQVSVYTVNGSTVASTPSLQNFYAFTGSGTIDLSTATPLAPSFMSSPTGVSIPGNLSVGGSETVFGPLSALGGLITTSLSLTGITVLCQFNSVLYVGGTCASTWGSGDIGAQINGAYTTLPANGGEIVVMPNTAGPASCYTFTTPILLTTASKYVLLRGDGADSQSGATSNGTCMNYTPTTTTTAITMDYVPSGGAGNTRNHGIRNLRLINNQCNTTGGCGSSATGVSYTSTNAGGQNAVWDSFAVVGFGTGVKIATPASSSQATWGVNFARGALSYNTTGLLIPNGIELTLLDDVKILGNATGVSMGTSSDLMMTGGSCDSNSINCIASTGGDITTSGVHFENQGSNNAQFINAGLSLHIYGGLALDDCASAGACGGVTPAYWFNSPAISVHGQDINSAGRVPTVVYKYSTSGFAEGITNISGLGVIARGNIIATVGGNAILTTEDTSLATIESALFEADSGTAFSAAMVGTLTGWGSTASVSTPQGGNQRFSFIVTSNGTGITANPTLKVTLTSPWPVAPLYQCKIIGGTGTPALVTGDEATISTTVIGPLVFNGTPAGSGATYQFACQGI